MKLSITALAAMLFSFILVSCKKGDVGPEGPQGPAGPQGIQGPTGAAGNANVTQYSFGTHNFATTASAFLGVTTTADSANRSAWLVYLVRSSGNVYPIPGFGLNGASEYRVFWSYSSGKVNFSISRVTGTGEEYTSIRIIRIYANQLGRGVQLSYWPEDLDVNDYYAVCRYYGIPY